MQKNLATILAAKPREVSTMIFGKATLLIAVFLVSISGATAAEPAELPDWVQTDHLEQIQRLNKLMFVLKADLTYRAYYDANIVPTTLHPASLILPTDKDAAQILWRRTRVLLDELKKPAPELAIGFEDHLASLKNRLNDADPYVPDYTTLRIDPSKLKKDDKDDMEKYRRYWHDGRDVWGKDGKSATINFMDLAPDPKHPRTRLALDILSMQRRIALANPLLGDCDLLLCLRANQGLDPEHIASQYKLVGGNSRSGLFRLSGYLGDVPVMKEILQGATLTQGRLSGQPLDAAARTVAKLGAGNFGWPDLSYDGRQIVFAWKESGSCSHGRENTIAYYNGTGTSQFSRERCYHIFAFDLDSPITNPLRMLTDGSGNDAHPSYLPNGRIVFLSDRRGGVERCGGPPRATKLHSMNPDGSDQVPLSFHETSEFSPAVDRGGKIIYGRWDYIDRGDCIAHHLWSCYPDGRDPRAKNGNYPEGTGAEADYCRVVRPNAEVEMQPIPGDHRLIAVAAAHHVLGHTGSLIVLDQSQPDDDLMSQVRRFTPDIGFPETGESVKGQNPSGAQPLACPWPLNINFTLAGSDRGPMLVDAFGNHTLLVSTDFPTREVIPLRPRPRPPIVPTQTVSGRPSGEPADAQEIPKTGTFTLINVYNSLKPWPKDTIITALRIVQIYPKSNTTWASQPQVGVASETLVRGLVGTVPVESDGSVRFEAPANQLLYFQALDAQGRAVQTMRSGTYLQPGAQVTCLGCHEPKHQAPPLSAQMPLALRQPVRQPKVGPSGSNPVFYPALVQTVLDRQCVSCHAKTRQEASSAKKMPPDLSPTPCGVQKAGWINGTTDRSVGKLPDVFYSGQGATTCWTVSYNSLAQYTGKNFGGKPIFYEGRTTPGTFGTLNSKLYPLLADGKHHDVKLSPEEMERLVIWMDLNSNFLGHYLFTEEQSRGILPALPPTEYFDTSDHPEARIPITAQKRSN